MWYILGSLYDFGVSLNIRHMRKLLTTPNSQTFPVSGLKTSNPMIIDKNQTNTFFEKLKVQGTFIFTLFGFKSFPWGLTLISQHYMVRKIISILTVTLDLLGASNCWTILLSKLIIPNEMGLHWWFHWPVRVQSLTRSWIPPLLT